jgi:hypothetical protein
MRLVVGLLVFSSDSCTGSHFVYNVGQTMILGIAYRYIWCCWQVFAPVIYVLNGYSSHLAYVRGTQNNHAWFKLNFSTYFWTCYNIYAVDSVLPLRDQHQIVHIFIDFTYTRFRPLNYTSHSILPAVTQFGLAIGTFRLSFDNIVCCLLC